MQSNTRIPVGSFAVAHSLYIQGRLSDTWTLVNPTTAARLQTRRDGTHIVLAPGRGKEEVETKWTISERMTRTHA